MKEFKLSAEKEAELFEHANGLLDLRQVKLQQKQNRWEELKNILSLSNFNIELRFAPLLIPATAAIILLLHSGESIEYESNFIELETIVIEYTETQGD